MHGADSRPAGGMTYTVYIDQVFAVNVLMDLLVLAAAGRLLGYRTRRIRLLAGALLGGAWSLAALFWQGSTVLAAFITYVPVSGLMAAAAYPVHSIREAAKAVGCMYLISVVLAGVMLALRETLNAGRASSFLIWILLAAGGAAGVFGFFGLISQMVRDMDHRRDLCQVILQAEGRREEVQGLIDTGNRLREPVSGRPVHVAEAELMERLCPRVDGVIFVPYQSVGGQGMLPAVFIDAMEVRLEKKSWRVEHPLVAVSKRPLSPNREYCILIQSIPQDRQHTFSGGHFHDHKSFHTKPFSAQDRRVFSGYAVSKPGRGPLHRGSGYSAAAPGGGGGEPDDRSFRQ